jgi:hypothetical protein
MAIHELKCAAGHRCEGVQSFAVPPDPILPGHGHGRSRAPTSSDDGA